jgi:hypothetical protein
LPIFVIYVLVRTCRSGLIRWYNAFDGINKPFVDIDPIVDTEGPLHTRAKSRDHEIVGAKRKCPMAVPRPPPKSCSVVTDPQV